MNRAQKFKSSCLRFASRLALVTALLGSAPAAVPGYAQGPDDYLPNEVLVKLAQVADLSALAAEYGLDPAPLDQFGSRAIFRLRILDGSPPSDKAAALAVDPRVLYAEPNAVAQAPEARQQVSWAIGGAVGDYAEQWAAGAIRLPEAHDVTRGAGITVAVLDTGVDLAHPVLAGRLLPGYDFVDLDAVPSEVGSPDQNVAYGHGTHVAGLVALAAPEAMILPIRVLDPDGRGNVWVLAEALAYAVDPDGDPNTADGAHVINLSLSTRRETNLLAEIVAEVTCNADDDNGDDSDDDDDNNGDDGDGAGNVNSLCRATGRRGAIVIAAAGNSSSDLPEYPAAENVNGMLAVAASTRTDSIAGFSNYGSWVHVAAPGELIISTVPGGGYGVWSGTSMAAPLVAGQAALIRSVYPALDAVAVAERIRATSVPIFGPVPLRVDAAAALN